ncbi:hypothetical protein NDU88_001539 [Pleurodeles waltl]|uniref:Uncharacterized protein n=1 Tax=Pleurodeles waltl TaxID=8319 RepID=A0AAV7R8A4_PLEWA|nr:hypothetical protein NDU88_001539 [Pleurodeles waltl]
MGGPPLRLLPRPWPQSHKEPDGGKRLGLSPSGLLWGRGEHVSNPPASGRLAEESLQLQGRCGYWLVLPRGRGSDRNRWCPRGAPHRMRRPWGTCGSTVASIFTLSCLGAPGDACLRRARVIWAAAVIFLVQGNKENALTALESWDWLEDWRAGDKHTPRRKQSARTSDQQSRVAKAQSVPSTSDQNPTEDRRNQRDGHQEAETVLVDSELRHSGAKE